MRLLTWNGVSEEKNELKKCFSTLKHRSLVESKMLLFKNAFCKQRVMSFQAVQRIALAITVHRSGFSTIQL